jgi:hypothetical protein
MTAPRRVRVGMIARRVIPFSVSTISGTNPWGDAGTTRNAARLLVYRG